jgi:hypothetical protein
MKFSIDNLGLSGNWGSAVSIQALKECALAIDRNLCILMVQFGEDIKRSLIVTSTLNAYGTLGDCREHIIPGNNLGAGDNILHSETLETS